jgi:hypothetical protein
MSNVNNNWVINFAEHAIGGAKLSPATKEFLNKKYEHLNNINRNGSVLLCVAHPAMLPYKIIALAVRTVADALFCGGMIIVNILTLGMSDHFKNELKARVYNLFVADLITWLSIPFSILVFPAYEAANNLHLGTFGNLTQKT